MALQLRLGGKEVKRDEKNQARKRPGRGKTLHAMKKKEKKV